MNPSPSPAWRPACLRGVCLGPEGPHALVMAEPGQYLRAPLRAPDLSVWQPHVGERVWIDLRSSPFQLSLQAPAGERRHA